MAEKREILSSEAIAILKGVRRLREELKEFFESLAERVEEADTEGLLLLPELYEEEGYMVWGIPGYEEDTEEKPSIELGVLVWAPSENEAALSVYAVTDGGSSSLRLKLLKILKNRFQGKLYLFSEDWSEDEVELKRWNLEEGVEVSEVVEVLLSAAKVLKEATEEA